jgi:type VI secretion system protein VasI
MLTRFDGEKATTEAWSISTDNKAVFVRGSDITFAKKMMNHKTLLTQITPYGESPVMATFPVAGLSGAIKPLREHAIGKRGRHI